VTADRITATPTPAPMPALAARLSPSNGEVLVPSLLEVLASELDVLLVPPAVAEAVLVDAEDPD
jgi:hypothetical protein